MSSTVDFEVVYVTYQDEDIYKEYSKYDIPKPGIYDDYLYQLKTHELAKKLEKEISNKFKTETLEVSFPTLTEETIPIIYSNTEKDYISELKHYNSLKKNISINDYYDEFYKINPGTTLKIDYRINENITKNNLDDFKKRVKELVEIIKKNGFNDYQINFTGFNYITCQVTKKLENNEEYIFLLFDYQIYSDIKEEDKLTMYTYK